MILKTLTFFESHLSKKKLHMLFSELNDSKTEVFSKSFIYAAEFNITVSFNNKLIYWVWSLDHMYVLECAESNGAMIK